MSPCSLINCSPRYKVQHNGKAKATLSPRKRPKRQNWSQSGSNNAQNVGFHGKLRERSAAFDTAVSVWTRARDYNSPRVGAKYGHLIGGATLVKSPWFWRLVYDAKVPDKV